MDQKGTPGLCSRDVLGNDFKQVIIFFSQKHKYLGAMISEFVQQFLSMEVTSSEFFFLSSRGVLQKSEVSRFQGTLLCVDLSQCVYLDFQSQLGAMVLLASASNSNFWCRGCRCFEPGILAVEADTILSVTVSEG